MHHDYLILRYRQRHFFLMIRRGIAILARIGPKSDLNGLTTLSIAATT